MIAPTPLSLCFDPERLKADLAAVASNAWVPHFNRREYEGDWRVVPLRSLGGLPRKIYSDPMAAPDDFQPTPVLQGSPYFQSVIGAFACSVAAARLMALGPGARIREHRDFTLDFEDGQARIHIPVATNDEVDFRLAGERMTMREGEAWYLDFSQPHSVFNGGSSDRVHLVVDCLVNDWLRELIGMGKTGDARRGTVG